MLSYLLTDVPQDFLMESGSFYFLGDTIFRALEDCCFRLQDHLGSDSRQEAARQHEGLT